MQFAALSTAHAYINALWTPSMAIMKSIWCFPLELNSLQPNHRVLAVLCWIQFQSFMCVNMCMYKCMLRALVKFECVRELWVLSFYLSLKDLLRPFSDPCNLRIMPMSFANTDFVFWFSKIRSGQLSHARKSAWSVCVCVRAEQNY